MQKVSKCSCSFLILFVLLENKYDLKKVNDYLLKEKNRKDVTPLTSYIIGFTFKVDISSDQLTRHGEHQNTLPLKFDFVFVLNCPEIYGLFEKGKTFVLFPILQKLFCYIQSKSPFWLIKEL